MLVVDDDPDVADLAGEYLERTADHLTVHTETSVYDALDRVAASTVGFDCIVSDYEMPGMDGIEFHHAVRERSETVPFILFTVRDAEAVADGSGTVTDYVRKDGTAGRYDELAARVTRAVAGTG